MAQLYQGTLGGGNTTYQQRNANQKAGTPTWGASLYSGTGSGSTAWQRANTPNAQLAANNARLNSGNGSYGGGSGGYGGGSSGGGAVNASVQPAYDPNAAISIMRLLTKSGLIIKTSEMRHHFDSKRISGP